jgi:hypothetical protein
MSANQSDLSQPIYGYDIVVATTQGSINDTMKNYLYNTNFPVVKMYWNQDADGNPIVVSYDDLMKQTNNTDPLRVPSWKIGEPESDDIKNIINSNFCFAFEASIGIPAGMTEQDIPNIVSIFYPNNLAQFNLICSDFTVVVCNFGRNGLSSFLNASQPPLAPWLFTSQVELTNIFDNNNLPPSVQQQLDNLGPDAFSVQQLFFDLDNAALESIPQISGIQPGTAIYSALQEVFLGAYFNNMKQAGQPVLNYSISQNSSNVTPTFMLTDMNFEVSPYNNAGDADLITLNYLCAVDGNTLPPSLAFSWNWIEAGEDSSFDGVIAINRNSFTNYFYTQLINTISSNCYATNVKLTWCGPLDLDICISASLTGGQTPTLTKNIIGQDVLQFSYNSTSSDNAGPNGSTASMSLSTNYNATITFVNNTIIIFQTLNVGIMVQHLLNGLAWNAIDKSITDTYTLSVTETGSLTSDLVSTAIDNSVLPPQSDWFTNLFTDLNTLVNEIENGIQTLESTVLNDIPINIAQQFVFPGGNSFAFKDVMFSEYQDLVSHISYVQPFKLS